MKQPTPSANNFLGTLSIILLLGAAFFLLVACGSTNRGAIPQDYQELDNLVSSRQFQIEHDWAIPMRGGNINLVGNSNFIRVTGDSVNLFLPYFGVRHMGGSYGRGGGIEYEGPLRDLQVERKEERINLSFEGDQEGEDLDFRITLYANGNANTSVQSSERDMISYRGEVREWIPENRNQ